MHSKCSGEIIIYMDDDDYYPPERVSHAVESLVKHPEYLIAGSSEMHIYFDTHKKIYQFGPYAENHSTAATFAFRRKLLKKTKYDAFIVISPDERLSILNKIAVEFEKINLNFKFIIVCPNRPKNLHPKISKKSVNIFLLNPKQL
jgi:glycosyltransferase involved in cell wall biosynthesis